MKKTKVFGLGLSRTGTTTLGKCLTILGYTVTDNSFEQLKLVKEGNLDPIWEITNKFDAFEDLPWPFIYKELYKKYPNAKFILTTHKDEETWLKSYIRHCTYGKRKTLWNSVRHNVVAYGIPYPVNHEEEFKKIYKKHNNDVRKFFKNKKNFKELCWMKGDRWEELCSFLGVTIPEKEFPHSYQSDWGYYERYYRIAKKHPDKFFPKYNGEEKYERK